MIKVFACACAAIVLALPAIAAPSKTTIVALGASVTAGVGWSKDGAFPAVLEEMLRSRGHSVTVLNAGVPDDTSEGMLNRLAIDIPSETRFVIYQPGANDRNADTNRNVAKILDTLRARDIVVYVYPSKMLEMQGKTLAAEHGAHFLGGPLQEAMGSGRGSRAPLSTEYFLADGVHLNGVGHRKVAEVLANIIEPKLRNGDGARPGQNASGKGAAKFAAMDADKDGRLSESEFFSGLPPKMPEPKKSMLFRSFDKNNDGAITADEFSDGPGVGSGDPPAVR